MGRLKHLYVKPTDTHQYLYSSSCHPYHCKKGILFSETLRLNTICSDSISFDRRCNDLERLLLERAIKKRLSKYKTQLTFNLTYYPVFKNVRKILEELLLSLTPDQTHKKVFSKVALLVLKTSRVSRTT